MQDTVAFISGGGSGIGQATAHVLARQGVRVALAGRTSEELTDRGAIPLTGDQPGSAEQVGDLIAFLVSDQASHISGTELWIDGAQSLLQG